MSLVVPNEGKIALLRYLVNKVAQNGGAPSASGDRVLALFKNDVTPAESNTFEDFLEPNVVTGYVRVNLSGNVWATSEDELGVCAAIYGSYAEFNFDEAITIYGYFVINQDEQLLWAEKFSTGPISIPAGGGQVLVKPKIELTNIV
jgi:hypothetical protein